MTVDDKLEAAKDHVVEKITDIIVKNFDEGGGALETAGTFTALLEAFSAIEIAIINKPKGKFDFAALAGE